MIGTLCEESRYFFWELQFLNIQDRKRNNYNNIFSRKCIDDDSAIANDDQVGAVPRQPLLPIESRRPLPGDNTTPITADDELS